MTHAPEHGHEQHAPPKSKVPEIKLDTILYALGALIVILAIVNIVQMASLSSILDGKIKEAEKNNIPPKVEMIILADASCTDCFDITPTVEGLRSSGINITSEQQIDYKEASVAQYNVTKVPTVLLKGEIDKIKRRGFEQRADALVFTDTTPLYVNPATGEVVGRVKATLITEESCTECIDLEPLITSLSSAGVRVENVARLKRTDAQAQQMIGQYTIESLPTLIVSKDLEAYGGQIVQNWAQIGSVEEDGAFVTRISQPPYYDLAENRIAGLVQMTVLADASCPTCYDPDTFHKPILQRMGVVFSKEERIDVASAVGQALLAKYNITQVPTILLKGDVESYPVLVSAWADVGDVDDDGTYVFRRVEVAQQDYKDLTTNTVVSPEPAQQTE